MIKKLFKTKKPKLAGILTIAFAGAKIAIALATGQPLDISNSVVEIIGGVGLLASKQSNVTGGTVQHPDVEKPVK